MVYICNTLCLSCVHNMIDIYHNNTFSCRKTRNQGEVTAADREVLSRSESLACCCGRSSFERWRCGFPPGARWFHNGHGKKLAPWVQWFQSFQGGGAWGMIGMTGMIGIYWNILEWLADGWGIYPAKSWACGADSSNLQTVKLQSISTSQLPKQRFDNVPQDIVSWAEHTEINRYLGLFSYLSTWLAGQGLWAMICESQSGHPSVKYSAHGFEMFWISAKWQVLTQMLIEVVYLGR